MAANDLPARPEPAKEPTQADAQITVVIPCYHAEATVGRAVDSALSQCDGQVAVIAVIDDRSSATQELLQGCSDSRIRVLMNDSNLGAPASRNRGLAFAATPFVAFLDADDFYEGDLLGPLVEKVGSEGAELGFAPTAHWDPKAGYTHHFVPDYRDHDDVFLRWMNCTGNLNNSSLVWSTDYLRQIGGWDEAILRNQDGELALRAILLGARFTTSRKGASVWFNDRNAARISTGTKNIASMLDVVSKLEAIPSEAVSDAARRDGLASHLHLVADAAYRAGEDRIGAEAMRRRRALGYRNGEGSLRSRLFLMSRFVPRLIRFPMWRVGLSLKKRIPAKRHELRRPSSS
jgi:glycosyltransferase involved in cell wall biosynthesis